MMLGLHQPKNAFAFNCFISLCCLVLACLCGKTFAQEKEVALPKTDVESKASPEDNKPEYGGVVVNQTLTGLGHYFYVNFSQSWSEKEDINEYVVAIKERPSPRGGTEVLILSDDVAVFRSFLPRSYAAVDGLSEAAVAQVHSKLSQMRIQAALFINNDLAGSGL